VPARARLSTGRLLGLLGIVGLVIAAGVLVVRRPARPLDVSTDPFPAPTTASLAALSGDQFIGSDRCAECHASQVAMWRGSTHARAGGSPNAVRLIAPFDGTPIRFSDAEVIPRSAGGRFTFTVRQSGAADRILSVDAVVGGGHMEGGGTQGFLTRNADGTLRFLPFDFSRHGTAWFCNTIGRGNRGWVPITPALSITDCVDWPPTRVMGDEPRFSNCQSCHGSQVRLTLDTLARVYRTEVASLGISCEACHGPGAPHLAALHDSAAVSRGDLGMASLATLAKDASLGTCWTCHALKDQLRPGFVSGQSLETYYSIRLPQLGDEALFPDGRVRTFAYQEGHLASDCYRNGGMTCTSCHDPHSQQYRDVSGAPLPGRFDDRQCTGCHASKADSATRHTMHAADSPGSRCTSCHMPYLQQPELGSAIPYARSDHTIPIPRPAADAAVGIRSACRGCHEDRPEAALDSVTRAWWGELKPLPDEVQALQRARVATSRREAARLVLEPGARHTQALFAGMAWFLERYVTRDMVDLEREVVERLEALATHADDDVSALALATLHVARGTEPRTRRFLIAQLRSLGPRETRVRARWGVVLGFLADRARGAGEALAAADLYRRALEVDPANPRIPVNLGLSLVDAGNLSGAVDAYRAALAADPAQPLTVVNLGIALARRNDIAGAVATYRRAMQLNPREPLAYFNLAALFARASQPDSALANFRRAAELDPSLTLANFYASGIYLERGDPESALREIEAGLRFDPTALEARRMREQLRRQLGRTP
jgi:tetratricopeptide (TPR) repeat protein